ncbi:MAG: hypothetical protein GTO16_03915 [Candidatus Aminicenantes bacterium]|nr:hypothetical protein [Candidatus Aminicenantes bacterium]
MKQNSCYKLRNSKKTRNLLFSCLAFFLVLSSLECGKKKFVNVFLPDGFSITAELAISDEERQLGLMFREKLKPDQGMLFVFKDEDFHSFWMKNMKISIDILWLDKEKRIVHIERNVPPCKKPPCTSYSSKIPAMYVLEIQAGMADEKKLNLYDRLEFILE